MGESSQGPANGLRSRWVAYAVSLVITSATLILRLGLGFRVGDHPALILFLIPVMLSAYIGGLGPGLVSTAIAALGADYYLLPPAHSLFIASASDSAQWAALILVGTLISILMESLHRSRVSQAPEPRHWLRTQRTVQAGFGTALALLTVIGVFSYTSLVRLRHDATSVQHTYEVIGSLRLLLATVTDAESAQRGFTITGDASYLARYDEAVQHVDGELVRVRQITADNADRQRQLDELAPIVTDRISRLGDIVALRRTQGPDAARAAVASGRGKQLQERILLLLTNMEAAERALLAEREIRAQLSTTRTRSIIVSGSVLAFATVAVGLFLIGRDFTGRARAEAALREANDQLETRVVERTAELARSIESLRASEAQLRTIVENLAEGLAVSDLKGQLLHFNRAALAMHGYASQKEGQRHLAEFTDTFELSAMDGTRWPLDQWPLARILRGEDLKDCEVRIRNTRAGWEKIFNYGGTLVRDDGGEAMMAVVTISDITEAKRAEQEIHRLNADLEQRVVDRTAQLEAANRELEAFSYSVSHDLRSPLRAVDGFSQAVLEDYGSQLPPEGRRHLQTIRQGAQKMGALIDDLLMFSKLSRQPLSKVPVDMNQLARATLEDLSRERNGRQIEVSIGDLAPAHGDPALLAQVWQNLLSNAIKYTRQRDQAAIKVSCNLENGRQVYAIQDNGIGFDMRYAHKLFGVFQRLHREEDFEGTGVGLAIVQRVVNRHGGRAWVDAAVDRGATFYFTLSDESVS